MSVKIARLKSGEDVIADVKEVSAKDDPNKVAVAFQFTEPYTVILEDSEEMEMAMWGEGLITDDEAEVTDEVFLDEEGNPEPELTDANTEEAKQPTLILYPWCPLARNREFYLRIDEVVTVYDPHTQVIDKYNELLEAKQSVNKSSAS
jgi:hypothetical protein